MSARDTTADLMARLKRHYIKPGQTLPGGVFLPEVGFNGNFGASNRCDALFIGFTNTSGRILVGHEVKASRADWLKELEQHDKADAWADQCHEWWLVSAPGIVHDGELPAGWGHMVPGRSKTRMTVIQRPTRHLDRQPSWDAARSILARADTLRADSIHEIRTKAREDARAEAEVQIDRMVSAKTGQGEIERLTKALERERQLLTDICGALGVERISNADPRRSYDSVPHVEDLAPLADLLQDAAAGGRIREDLTNRYTSAQTFLEDAAKDLAAAVQKLSPARPTDARGGG